MINFLYTLLIIGLAAGVYAQWWLFPVPTPILTKPTPVQNVVPDNATSATTTPTLKSLRSKRSYSRISERPLFLATRRPAVEEVEPPPPAPLEEPKPPVEEQRLDGLMLTAVIVKGTERIALMKDPQIDKTLRLKQGEMIRGWSVTTVGQDTISLLSPNGTSSDLNLRVFRPPIAQPTQAIPIPPPPAVPPPEATNAPPGEMPGRLPPQFNRRRSRRPPTL